MGNSQSEGEGHMKIPRLEYDKRLKEYENLLNQNRQKELKIKELEGKIKNLQSQNTFKNEEVQALKVELSQHDSIPAIKCVLNVNTHITQLEGNITEFLNTSHSERNEQIREEISKLKQSIQSYYHTLPRNLVSDLSCLRGDELRKLEDDIQFEQEFGCSDKYETLNEVLVKLKNLKENISVAVAKSLVKFDKEIDTHRNTFNNMQNMNTRSKYEEIKAILVQQENELLKLKLNIQKPKEYSLIFCNITEEYVDFRNDYEKIREILTLFHGISTDDIKVFRLGVRKSDKPRVLKVIFSNMNPVTILLRNKHLLKDSHLSHVRIYPNKYENNNK